MFTPSSVSPSTHSLFVVSSLLSATLPIVVGEHFRQGRALICVLFNLLWFRNTLALIVRLNTEHLTCHATRKLVTTLLSRSPLTRPTLTDVQLTLSSALSHFWCDSWHFTNHLYISILTSFWGFASLNKTSNCGRNTQLYWPLAWASIHSRLNVSYLYQFSTWKDLNNIHFLLLKFFNLDEAIEYQNEM